MFFSRNKNNLFSTEIPPACGYCANGNPSRDGAAILCPRCGVVSHSYHCKKFVYDPISRIPMPFPKRQEYDPSDFLL